jgi:hypothetical protein
MRRAGKLVSLLSLGCFALGCAETPKRAEIKPAKEDFHLPDPGLAAAPPAYPPEMLNKVSQRKPGADDENLGPPSLGGGGGGPSMSGGGMGSGPH